LVIFILAYPHSLFYDDSVKNYFLFIFIFNKIFFIISHLMPHDKLTGNQ